MDGRRRAGQIFRSELRGDAGCDGRGHDNDREPEGRGDLLAAYVCDMISSGTAPIEYCSSAIRDIILSNRKHELLAALERDLLEGALDSKQFVIY